MNRQFGKDPWCLYTGKHLFNFVDNHDVERVASILEDKNQLPLIYTMLFTMPGIPCIYYGSEWGMEGTKNWNDTDLRPEIKVFEWNELTDTIQKLIHLKNIIIPLYLMETIHRLVSQIRLVFIKDKMKRNVYGFV